MWGGASLGSRLAEQRTGRCTCWSPRLGARGSGTFKECQGLVGGLPDWASLSECQQELFGRNLALAQEPGHRADLDFAVKRNDAAFAFSFHHHVAAALTNLDETKPFEGVLNVSARDVWQFRHVPARAR